MRNALYCLFFLLLMTVPVFGQTTILEFKGKVVEHVSQNPVSYATVAFITLDSNKVIAGTTTDELGNFVLSGTEEPGYIKISFIGFITKTITDFEFQHHIVELGTVSLEIDSKQLDVMEIRGEKSTTEFKLDKRVFNVGKDLSTTGAGAMEVLNNVPSVNVDIEGAVTLRGSSGVQILIDGKPPVAGDQGNALSTITADMIESVEVITNPSAKYDAEGTSGIINIILKKENKKGINGSISLNTGTPHNHSVGVSLNRRTERFNLFSQLGAGYRAPPSFRNNRTTDLRTNTSIISESVEYRNEEFYNFVLGTDFHIDSTNVLTLSGNYALELEKQPSATDYSIVNASDETTSSWQRTEATTAFNPKYRYELQYKSDFKDHKDHMLLVSALGNFFGKDQSSDFADVTTFGASDRDATQKTMTNFEEAKYTFKADYTKPFKKKFTIETGAQYVIQDVANDYAVSNFTDGEWIQFDGLTNTFLYKQDVLAGYTTAAYEHKKVGLKLGLRAEHTDLETILATTSETNKLNYLNLFPTVHSSYKLSKFFSLQAGYSKRIYRPRLWDLNPFFNIRNNFSIRTGNPNLLPELTDSYEVSGIWILKKLSLNFSLYNRITNSSITRVSSFADGVTTFMPMNIGVKRATGIEFNTKFTVVKKVTMMGDYNFNSFKRVGEFSDQSFDFTATFWTTKWTANIKLPKDFSMEITGRYQSKEQTVQGTNSAQIFGDMGFRKKIMKGKAVLNISVRDIFASKIRHTYADQPTFSTYSSGTRGRRITLGFSYGFGKGEAMQFSGGRRH